MTSTVKTAIYLRISSDTTGQQLGVDRQLTDCLALCRARGWTPIDPTRYRENDTSASSGKRRRKYELMLDDIRAGKIDAVVAWDLDRLHRRPIELEGFMALADEHRLKLATVSGDVDLSKPQGRLMARMKGSVAAHDIEQMRQRMVSAAQQKAGRGVPQWKRAFGYTDDHQPDPVTAPLVREMYATVLAGGSLSGLARELNARGEYAWGQKWLKPKDDHGDTIKSADAKVHRQPWSATTLSLFLRNPRNASLRTRPHRCALLDHPTCPSDGTDEIIRRGTWPPLVDESTWRAVQSKLTAPGRAPGPKSVRQHLLTGVLACGKPGCGGRLAGQWVMQATGGPKSHAITYACRSCRGVSMRAEHVEPLTVGLVAARLARPDAVELVRDPNLDAAEAQRVRQERQTLTARLDEIADMMALGELTRKQAARATALVTGKLADLDAQDQHHDAARVLDGIPLGTDGVAAALEGLTPDRLRAVIARVATITVLPIGKGRRLGVEHRDRLQVEWNN